MPSIDAVGAAEDGEEWRLKTGPHELGEEPTNSDLDRRVTELYDALHRMASRYFSQERPGHTLQVTALVHEAYLRLAKQKTQTWANEGHFICVAARMMFRALADHARRRERESRVRIRCQDLLPWGPCNELALCDVVDLLEALEKRSPERYGTIAAVARLRIAGYSDVEAAKICGVTLRHSHENYQFAKGWLRRECGIDG